MPSLAPEGLPAPIQAKLTLAFKQGAHEAHQFANLERLAQQDSILDATLVKVKRGVGGEEEYAASSRPLVGTQPLIDLRTAQVRQPHVEQHNIRWSGAGQIQGMRSFGGYLHLPVR